MIENQQLPRPLYQKFKYLQMAMRYISNPIVKISVASFRLFLTISSFIVCGIRMKKNIETKQQKNLNDLHTPRLSPGQTPANFMHARVRLRDLCNSDFDIFLDSKFSLKKPPLGSYRELGWTDSYCGQVACPLAILAKRKQS